MRYKGERTFFKPRTDLKKKGIEIYKIDKYYVTNSILDLRVERTRTVQRMLV